MAVSKDGTLAFISFSTDEIGCPLSEDETVSMCVCVANTWVLYIYTASTKNMY